jgi:DNA-binding MarR family transcriptional regulator
VEPQEMDQMVRDLIIEINLAYRRLAEESGINHTDLMCLFVIRSGQGQSTPKAVSQRLGLTTGATAIMLNRLEAAGFIERHPHPTDRRGVLLALGPKVEHSGILGLRDRVAAMNRDVIARYSDADLAIVRGFFTDLVRNTHDTLVAVRSAKQQSLPQGADDAPED